ncbi:MAG: DUF697 domain-containing protein [Rhodospirillaceae bacterium]|nr:DUF697 domain-containing protein [Rhodospirillaceae bacterium]
MTQPFTVKAPPLDVPEPGDASVEADPLAAAVPPLNPALNPADDPPAERLGRRLLWILGGLVAAAVLVDLVGIGYAAVVAPTAGTIAWGLVYLAAVACAVVLIGRQVAAIRRLEAIGLIRAEADTIVSGALAGTSSTPHAGALFGELDRLYAGRADTAWSHARYAEAAADAIDAGDRLAVFEETVLAPLDARATDAITRAARRTAVFTAISPFVVLDVAVTLWRAVILLRAIAEIYGARASGLAAMGLLRRVLGQVALAGGLEATHEVTTELLGGGITARVSTRIGQGVVNGLFMIRLGLGAMDACRACTFRRVARPKVLDLARRSLSVLRQAPAA